MRAFQKIKMKNRKNSQLGAFTLMEALFAVIILGTMVSLSMPRLTQMIAQSYEKGAAVNLLTIRTALNFYKSDHNGYPNGDLNDVNAINNTLGLGIANSPVTYQCTDGTNSSYDCRATSPEGWQVQTTNSFLSGDPHCNTTVVPCPACTTTAKCPFLP